MRFGSVCSGIEAASVAWKPLGWQAAWFSEIEPFPSAVLAHHYPTVPNHGDMMTLPERVLASEVEAPDLLCGGTPCQAFSVAGLRRSLDDARGNLSLTFCELADAIDTVRSTRGDEPAIVFWENVPGVLSTADNAFGCFLGRLAGSGCELQPPGRRWSDAGCVLGPARAVAWRILDAQYFGLAQRRRRVFVVASARAGFDPATVLLEFEGVRRDSAPSRDAGEEAAPCVTAGAANGGAAHGARSGSAKDNLIVPVAQPYTVANCLTQRMHKGINTTLDEGQTPVLAHTLRGAGFDAGEDGTGRGTPIVPVHAFDARQSDVLQYGDKTGPLDTDGHSVAVLAFQPRIARNGRGNMGEVVNALQAQSGQTGKGDAAPCVATGMAVRRLTPRECERLQGFPDDYTTIPWRGRPAEDCPDGPRYKALGNSWAVPVVRWIGQRISIGLAKSTDQKSNAGA